MTYIANYTHFNFIFTGRLVNDIPVFENVSTPIGIMPELVLYRKEKYWESTQGRIARSQDKAFPWVELHSEAEFTIHVRRGLDGKPQFQVNIVAHNYDWDSRKTLEAMVRDLFTDWLYNGALDNNKLAQVAAAR